MIVTVTPNTGIDHTVLAGLGAGPYLIKLNREEFGELLGYLPSSSEEVQEAAWRVRAVFQSNVIATLGAAGAFAALKSGSYADFAVPDYEDLLGQIEITPLPF